MKNNKNIAVLMATYNGEKYLRQQLISIREQTYKNFSLFIGDDNSKDNTVKIINEFRRETPDLEIKLIINKENIGFRKNFENLVNQVTEEYVAFCDQDDIWTKNHLEVLIKNIEEYDICCADAELIDGNGNKLNATLSSCRQMNKIFTDKKNVMLHLLHNNFVQGTAMLVRKALLDQCIPIPDNIEFHDYWFASIASFNKGVNYVNKTILLYRQHSNNVTKNEKYNIFEKIKKNRKKDYNYFERKIDYLETIQKRCSNIEYKKILADAIEYYNNIIDGRKSKVLKYFIKNYEVIFFDTKKSYRYMLRMLKYLF